MLWGWDRGCEVGYKLRYKIRSWVGCHFRSVLYIVERCGLCIVKVWDWDSYRDRNECHEGKTIYHL